MVKVRILRLKDMNFEVTTLHSIFFFIEIFQTFCSLPHNIMLHEFIFLPEKKNLTEVKRQFNCSLAANFAKAKPRNKRRATK